MLPQLRSLVRLRLPVALTSLSDITHIRTEAPTVTVHPPPQHTRTTAVRAVTGQCVSRETGSTVENARVILEGDDHRRFMAKLRTVRVSQSDSGG